MGKTYIYKGKKYNDDQQYFLEDGFGGDLDDLINELEKDGHIETNEITVYYIGGDIVGTDNDLGPEELIDKVIEYGYDVEEVNSESEE